MKVRVVLYGNLRRLAGAGERELELSDGSTVADAIMALGLPDRVDIWALVDGRRAGRGRELYDGVEVRLFQPVGGG